VKIGIKETDMTRHEQVAQCEKDAKDYSDGEFDMFSDEMGWEEWMGDYLHSEDQVTSGGYKITLDEYKDITGVQAEGWNEAHPNDRVTEPHLKNKFENYMKSEMKARGRR
jgi:hypothetical protein